MPSGVWFRRLQNLPNSTPSGIRTRVSGLRILHLGRGPQAEFLKKSFPIEGISLVIAAKDVYLVRVDQRRDLSQLETDRLTREPRNASETNVSA